MASSYTTPAGRFVDVTQARADAAAHAYACQQARALVPTNCATPTDMPLDQCVYVPASGSHAAFIAGVRGGYVFKLDPTTGVKITSARIPKVAFSPTSIAYEPVSNLLVVSNWMDPNGDQFYTPSLPSVHTPNRYLAAISPSTLAPVRYHDMGNDNAIGPLDTSFCGPFRVYPLDTGEVLVLYMDNGTYPIARVCAWNPLTDVIRVYSGGGGAQEWQAVAFAFTDAAYDFVGRKLYGVAWTFQAPGGTQLQPFSPDTFVVPDIGSWPIGTDIIPPISPGVWNEPFTPQGVALNATATKAYVVTGSPTVLVSTTAIITTHQDRGFPDITLPDSNATPYYARSNPSDGLIYVPGFASNSVYVIDPATDTVVATKTGFDSPRDCVFTPTKKFAVQLGAVGLKEIV